MRFRPSSITFCIARRLSLRLMGIGCSTASAQPKNGSHISSRFSTHTWRILSFGKNAVSQVDW